MPVLAAQLQCHVQLAVCSLQSCCKHTAQVPKSALFATASLAHNLRTQPLIQACPAVHCSTTNPLDAATQGVDALLRQLHVRWLVLPSIKSVLAMWRYSFSFIPLTLEEQAALEPHIVSPGTTTAAKPWTADCMSLLLLIVQLAYRQPHASPLLKLCIVLDFERRMLPLQCCPAWLAPSMVICTCLSALRRVVTS